MNSRDKAVMDKVLNRDIVTVMSNMNAIVVNDNTRRGSVMEQQGAKCTSI